MRAGALICFEAIFPDIARQETVAGANLLVNLTNDAWYGRSSAPQQSWAMAVLRAVENRRSMVRAANTGISGLVAPTGAVLRKSNIFTEDALTGTVPLLTIETVFAQGGWYFGPACVVLTGCLLLHAAWTARQQRHQLRRQKQKKVVAEVED